MVMALSATSLSESLAQPQLTCYHSQGRMKNEWIWHHHQHHCSLVHSTSITHILPFTGQNEEWMDMVLSASPLSGTFHKPETTTHKLAFPGQNEE
jgi:hypothetical protein